MTKGKPLSVYIDELLNVFDIVAEYLDGVDQSRFMRERMRQDAVLRNIELAGEISGNIRQHHSWFDEKAPEARFKGLNGMRNVVLHGYHKVDLDVVWEAASVEFPMFRDHLIKAVDKHGLTPPGST